MNPLSSMLLLLFCSAPFGEPTERSSHLWNPPHTVGEHFKYLASLAHWNRAIPCSESKSSPSKEEPKSTLSLLCENQGHLGPGVRPARSKTISVPQGSLLMEREKDLSTYNWNSFGLRYGKRQADVVEAMVKML